MFGYTYRHYCRNAVECFVISACIIVETCLRDVRSTCILSVRLRVSVKHTMKQTAFVWRPERSSHLSIWDNSCLCLGSSRMKGGGTTQKKKGGRYCFLFRQQGMYCIFLLVCTCAFCITLSLSFFLCSVMFYIWAGERVREKEEQALFSEYKGGAGQSDIVPCPLYLNPHIATYTFSTCSL